MIEGAMAAAEAASVAKSQFLANTSHEIRTPLNAVIGYAQLLELGLAGPLGEQQRQYLGRIQATSQHLLSLINDVLDLAKIEAGEMRAAREPRLVREVVASAIELVEPQLRSRQLAFVNGCGGDGGAYSGDAERVRQILVNLLSNATRFTDPGGRITVTCGARDRAPGSATATHPGPWTFVRVEDTGVGIPAEQLERIWHAFVQVADADDGGGRRSAYTRKFGGSGLGLHISRHLARLMGGDITVASEPGTGSSFVLWLPAADPRDVRDGGAAAPPRESETTPATPPPAERGERAPEDAMLDVQDAARQGDESAGRGLLGVADALLTEIERILAMYVARLRADTGTPSAHGIGGAQAEDHSTTFLADLAQSLSAVAQDGPEALEMLRDGSAIQRLIAGRHGAQRARLGWSEEELRRDLALFREEIHAAIRRGAARGSTADVERAVGVLNHLLDQAERESLDAYRKEGGDAESRVAR